MKDPVAHYLTHHAEPEAGACARALAGHGPFRQCVIVPAMGEGPNLLRALASVPESDTLAVVVVNARADADAEVHANNALMWERLAAAYGAPAWVSAPGAASPGPRMAVYDMPQGALLLVYRAEAGHFLPPQQGVGLARKIGVDVALALHRAGVVASPWLACTDADAVVPADYFAQLRSLDDRAAAATFRFFHDPADGPAQARAIVHYEATLRYYVHGLRWAGSPYAYHTVGSTLAIHATAYARVRGFPKRMAAEDFYVMDKLRKVGPVVALGGSPLMLSGRTSSRVPFGTGRAMLQARVQREAPRVYHPHVFFYVRALLDALALAASESPRTSENAQIFRMTMPEGPLAPVNGTLFRKAADFLRVPHAIDAARANTRSASPRRRFLHTWFDAFRTLKLVHYLRDEALSTLPLCEAVAVAPFDIRATTPRAALAALVQRDHRSNDGNLRAQGL